MAQLGGEALSPHGVRVASKRRGTEQLVWQRNPSPVAVETLLAEHVPGLSLQDIDYEMLEFCLRCNYVTPEQAEMLGTSRATAHRRLGKLFQIGLLDRVWRVYERYMDMVGFQERRIGGWVYTVSQSGFDFLLRTKNKYAVRWQGDWSPRSMGEGTRKLSVSHELTRNEVLLSALAAARQAGELVIGWEGPRESYQYVPPRSPGAKSVILEPDGLIVLRSGRPMFLEYEQSGRIDRFTKKMLDFNRYVAVSGWKESGFSQRPWMVYAVGSGDGTQERASGSLGGLVQMAGKLLTSERHYLFLDETAWVNGDWQATNGEGKQVPFWDTVLSW